MQRGQKVAVVGESGSGKSTVMASWRRKNPRVEFTHPKRVGSEKEGKLGHGQNCGLVEYYMIIGPDLNGTHNLFFFAGFSKKTLQFLHQLSNKSEQIMLFWSVVCVGNAGCNWRRIDGAGTGPDQIQA